MKDAPVVLTQGSRLQWLCGLFCLVHHASIVLTYVYAFLFVDISTVRSFGGSSGPIRQARHPRGPLEQPDQEMGRPVSGKHEQAVWEKAEEIPKGPKAMPRSVIDLCVLK